MPIPIRYWRELKPAERERILRRSEADISEAVEAVKPIILDVRSRGDAALLEYTARFDAPEARNLSLKVASSEFDAAEKSLSAEIKDALEFAVENVRRFHEGQKPGRLEFREVRPGVFSGERAVPIESCGLYVPRGRGSFPSMTYMLAVPAVLAGVGRIAIISPPNPDGSSDAACLFAARLCSVSEFYRAGGAQALAALAFGTETISPVMKIMGPGSRYVAAAKLFVSRFVDVGIPAGPSESIILADGSADPRLVALDLLIEAEHGADSQAILITDDKALALDAAVKAEELLADLPEPRRGFASSAIYGYGGIIVADSADEAVEIVNEFAPEHLQIQTASPFDYLSRIKNAGEILLGDRVPFSCANYAAGPNAVLPTGGRAKTWGPVSVRDFMKYQSLVYCTDTGFGALAPSVAVLAEYEGFPAHAAAVKKRGKPRGAGASDAARPPGSGR
jgi:histidinol dehydrogenase